MTRLPLKVTRPPLKVTRDTFKVTRYTFKVTKYAVKVTRYTFKVTRYAFKVTRYTFKVSIGLRIRKRRMSFFAPRVSIPWRKHRIHDVRNMRSGSISLRCSGNSPDACFTIKRTVFFQEMWFNFFHKLLHNVTISALVLVHSAFCYGNTIIFGHFLARQTLL